MRRTIAVVAALLALAPARATAAAPVDSVVISVQPRTYLTRSVLVDQGYGATLYQLDPGLPHDVISEDRTADGEPLFYTPHVLEFGESEAITGVPQLRRGDYPFTCSLHPDMFGMLVVRAI